MTKSDIVLAIAERVPPLGKFGVWAWVHVALLANSSKAEHWLVEEVTSKLAYRVPVWTRLGNGLKIRVAWNDMIGYRICKHGYYEPDTVQLFQDVIEDGMVVLDVGAHVGQYSLVASQEVGARGQVHSFEPDPRTFAWLAGNVRVNQLQNVTLNKSAVADDQEPKRLFFSPTKDIGSNSLAELEASYRTGRSQLVDCTTLDAYAASKGLARIDVIKADVEGAELAMLRGATRILSAPSPPTLILEFEEERQQAFGSSCIRLAQELYQYGYRLWHIGERLEPYTPSANGPKSLNVCAVHPSRQAVIEQRNGSHGR